MVERSLQKQITIAKPGPLQIVGVSYLRDILQLLDFTAFSARELHGLYGRQRILDSYRHLFPQAVILVHT